MSAPRGEYRSIYVALWNGPDWQQLTPVARLVWLALKGNCGPCGIAALPGLEHALAEWTGHDTAAVSHALAQLQHGRTPWVRREKNVVWVLGGIAHEPSRNVRNGNHREAAQSHVASLPRLPIVRAFLAAHPEWFPPTECRDRGIPDEMLGMGDGIPDGIQDGMGEHGDGDGERKTEVYGASASDAPAVSSPARPTPKVATRYDYPPEFEAAWAAYPARDGSNPKRDAYRAWKARVEEGATPEALRAGVDRYAAWARAREKEGTEGVMQAVTFFGPGERWQEAYAITLAVAPSAPTATFPDLVAALAADYGLLTYGGDPAAWKANRDRALADARVTDRAAVSKAFAAAQVWELSGVDRRWLGREVAQRLAGRAAA